MIECKVCGCSLIYEYGNGFTCSNFLCLSHGQSDESIIGFFGPYRFLSNFYACEPITYEGLVYNNAENAYQAAKITDHEGRKEFQTVRPSLAKRMGSCVTLRPDWEYVKIDVMNHILHLKFNQPAMREKLLATGDKHLEERNNWGDTFWGTTEPGVGQNILGKLLMSIRSEYKQSETL